MADGDVLQDELTHASQTLIGAFPQRASGVAGVAALANAGWLHQLPEETWSRYQSDIASVQLGAVKQAAMDWYRPERAALVVVGAADALDAVQGPLVDAGLDVDRTDLNDARFEGMSSD